MAQMNNVDSETDYDDKTSMSPCHAGILNDDRDPQAKSHHEMGAWPL